MRTITIEDEKIVITEQRKKFFSKEIQTTKSEVLLKDVKKIVKDITWGSVNQIMIFTNDGEEENIQAEEVENLEETFQAMLHQKNEVYNFKVCTYDYEAKGSKEEEIR